MGCMMGIWPNVRIIVVVIHAPAITNLKGMNLLLQLPQHLGKGVHSQLEPTYAQHIDNWLATGLKQCNWTQSKWIPKQSEADEGFVWHACRAG